MMAIVTLISNLFREICVIMQNLDVFNNASVAVYNCLVLTAQQDVCLRKYECFLLNVNFDVLELIFILF